MICTFAVGCSFRYSAVFTFARFLRDLESRTLTYCSVAVSRMQYSAAGWIRALVHIRSCCLHRSFLAARRITDVRALLGRSASRIPSSLGGNYIRRPMSLEQLCTCIGVSSPCCRQRLRHVP